MSYNPADVGVKGQLFGYPYSEEEADLIILPIPWDVTVSYGEGTALGPKAVLNASPQLDFEIPGIAEPWKYKIFMKPVSSDLLSTSIELRKQAVSIINKLENGGEISPDQYHLINNGCAGMVENVYELANSCLKKGKVCATLGGDHSTPLGLIRALSEKTSFGILQIDAHMDLRDSYEGFDYSHASIMHNVLKLPNIQKLVQVGIRDYAFEEQSKAEKDHRITVFFDKKIKAELWRGKSWAEVVDEVISKLPQNVYISFDVDGLDPSLCPNTGTPVPGGLSFDQIDFLIDRLANSGKKIIGFDLSEVAPGLGEWDANVGARILFRLCTYLAVSQGKLTVAE